MHINQLLLKGFSQLIQNILDVLTTKSTDFLFSNFVIDAIDY